MSGRWVRTAGLLIAGLLLAAFAVFLGFQGVEKASWWAGIGGFFLGVAALAVAVWPAPGKGITAPGDGAAQSVERVDAGRGVDVVDAVAGSVRLGVPPQPGSVTSPSSVPEVSGEQSVKDVRADGAIRVIRGVGGDVEIAP